MMLVFIYCICIYLFSFPKYIYIKKRYNFLPFCINIPCIPIVSWISFTFFYFWIWIFLWCCWYSDHLARTQFRIFIIRHLYILSLFMVLFLLTIYAYFYHYLSIHTHTHIYIHICIYMCMYVYNVIWFYYNSGVHVISSNGTRHDSIGRFTTSVCVTWTC